MANHKSAKKATRQAEKRTIANRSRMTRIRTYVKKVEGLTAANTTKEDAIVALREAEKEMRRGVTKGLLHQNTVSRKISRMVKRVKTLFSPKK